MKRPLGLTAIFSFLLSVCFVVSLPCHPSYATSTKNNQEVLVAAKTAIKAYFNALSNAEESASANQAMKQAMDAVKDPQDQKMSYVYYQYYVALDLTNQYDQNPTLGYLSSARKSVSLLHHLNRDVAITSPNNQRLEDELLHTLASSFDVNNNKIYDVSYVGQELTDAGNSFGTSIVLYCDGQSLLVSAPGNKNSNSDFGAIYYFQKQQGNNAWSLVSKIQPEHPVAGDHFGRVFVMGYDSLYQADTLMVSSEPVNGQAAVYIFTRQKGEQAWIQRNQLELKTPHSDPVYSISLAFSNDSVVSKSNNNTLIVGFSTQLKGGYGKYFIFEHSHYTAATDVASAQDVWDIAMMGAVNDSIHDIQSVAVKGNYAAVGYKARNNQGTGHYVLMHERVLSDGHYNWMMTKEMDMSQLNSGPVDAMPLVFHDQSSVQDNEPAMVTLLIGCPNFSNSKKEVEGAVFEVHRLIDLDNKTEWSLPKQLNLQMFTQHDQYAPKNAGYKMVLDNGLLLVGAQTRSDPSTYVYQLFNGPKGNGVRSELQYLFGPNHQLSLTIRNPKAVATQGTAVAIAALNLNHTMGITVIDPSSTTKK